MLVPRYSEERFEVHACNGAGPTSEGGPPAVGALLARTGGGAEGDSVLRRGTAERHGAAAAERYAGHYRLHVQR